MDEMLQTVLHAAINVSDLELSEQFYGTVLGLTKVNRPLSFPGTWYQLGSFQLHLIETKRIAVQAASPPLTHQDPWGRNPHLAFAIANITTTTQRLVEANVPVQASASGRTAVFTQDPDGNVIELTQL